MGIVFVFQYRGEKARLFSVYRDDASKYLEGFFGDDLRRFRLPVDPHECHLKAWRASRVLCKWETRRDSDLYAQLMQAMEQIKGMKDTLYELELVKVEFKVGTYYSDIWVSPSGTGNHNPVPTGPGKAPTGPRSTLLARQAVSPYPLPETHYSESSRHESFRLNDRLTDAHPNASGFTPRIQYESEGGLAPKLEEDGQDASRPLQGTHAHAPSREEITYASSSAHISTRTRRPSIVSSERPPDGSNPANARAPDASTLQNEVSEVRDMLETLRAKEEVFSEQLPSSHGNTSSLHHPSTVAERSKALGEEIRALKAQLEAETEARRAAELQLAAERERRELAESAVEDAQRECTAPFVIPALMDAFIKISQLSDDLCVV